VRHSFTTPTNKHLTRHN